MIDTRDHGHKSDNSDNENLRKKNDPTPESIEDFYQAELAL